MNYNIMFKQFKKLGLYWWIRAVFYGFYKKYGLQKSHALAYVALVSFAPLSISVGLIANKIIPDKVYAHYEDKLLKDYIPGIGSQVSHYVHVFQSHAFSLSIVSIIILLTMSLLMINNIRANLDQMLEVNRKKYNFSAKIGIVVLLFIGIIFFGFGLIYIKETLKVYILGDVLKKYTNMLTIVGYINSIFAFSVIYKFFPHTKVNFSDAFFAGSIVAVMFQVAKYIFILYISYISLQHIVYGSLVIVPLFLFWLDIMAIIFLLGAQIIFVRQKYRIKIASRQ